MPVWGLLALVITAAYANSLTTPFVLDDLPNIVNNQALTHGFSGRLLFPPLGTGVASRPVVNVTLGLNWFLSGPSEWSYHVFNLLIHALVAVFLFLVAERTFERMHHRRPGPAAPSTLALLGTLVWAVHPLQTQAVTYIIQRCETLMSLFLMLTLYAAIRSWESTTPRRWRALSVLSCLLGVGSKEVMIAAPFVVLTYDALFVSGSLGKALKRSSALYGGYAAALATLAALVVLISMRQPDQAGLPLSPLGYLLTQSGVLLHYLRLSFWPVPLVFDYGWTPAALPAAIPSLLGILILAGGSLYLVVKRNPAGFLGAWFFLILAPSSSMWPLRDLAFEHRMYLPLAAVVFGVVWGGFRLVNHFITSRAQNRGEAIGTRRRQDYVVLLSVLILVATLGTHLRNQTYASEIRLWEDTVRKRPTNPRAHTSLGVAYERAGRPDKAVDELRKAVELQPDAYDARFNLGIGLTRMGQAGEAIDHLSEALALRPGDVRASSALGAAFCQQGRLDEGIAVLRAGLRSDPHHPDLHFNLGLALAEKGDAKAARDHFQRVLAVEPGNSAAQHFLSTLPAVGE